MCDQTIPYSPGTWVWAKIMNRVWWPGKIIEVSSVPNELEYYLKKKNVKTAVFFDRDKSYELISNFNNVCLYSCAKKMEFLEKGYLLYSRHEKKGTSVFGIKMINFIEDVQNVERDIGGDINIFDQFIKKKQFEENQKKSLKYSIKELFPSENSKKKRGKHSLSLSSSATKPKSTSKMSLPVQSTRQSISKMPVVPQGFLCPYCNDFSTNRYNNLKRHMEGHKNENRDTKNEETLINKKSLVTKKSPKSKKSASSTSTSSPLSISSTPKKRKNTKAKNTDSKKVKLQDELLKDWDDGDDDLDNNTVQVKEKTLDNDSDSNKDTDQDLSQAKDFNQDSDTDQNKVTKIDTVAVTINNKVKESTPTRIFDFDDNDDSEMCESFQSHSNLGTSSDNSNTMKMSWDSVAEIIGTINSDKSAKKMSSKNKLNSTFDSVGEEVSISTLDDLHNEISDIKNELKDVHTEVEKIIVHVNEETSNDKDYSSNIDSVQLENINTNDKADAELGHNIDIFLSSLPEPDWVKKDNWEKLNSKNGYDKEFAFVDYFKRLQVNPFPVLEENCNDNLEKTFSTEITPPIPKDVKEKLGLPSKVTLYFPETTPVHSTEEIKSSETYRQMMEMVGAGGKLIFELNCPKESDKQ